MKKPLLYFFAILGIIFAYYLFQAMKSGFDSSFAPTTQVQKAKCLADCREQSLSENCDQYCVAQK